MKYFAAQGTKEGGDDLVVTPVMSFPFSIGVVSGRADRLKTKRRTQFWSFSGTLVSQASSFRPWLTQATSLGH